MAVLSSNDRSAASVDVMPPAVKAAFLKVGDVDEAERFTRALAGGHYENFSVVSRLLPRHLRQDFCNVYAFCRTADDLGDEMSSRQMALALLRRFRDATIRCHRGKAESAVFVALGQTIKRHDIPVQPFLDLISAFEQDQRIRRYDTFGALLDYCRRSANPVGRIVLCICGYRDEQRQFLSDRICTGLQLANFWQDVRRDLIDLDRIYLPRESMERFKVSEDQLKRLDADEAYRSLIRFEVERTEAMFDEGDVLLPLLDAGIRPQIALFSGGGRAILKAIAKQGYDTLTRRPTLSKWDKGTLIARMLMGRARGRLRGTAREAGA